MGLVYFGVLWDRAWKEGGVHYSIREAKDKFCELLKAAEKGKRVRICRRGKPVASLIPTTASSGKKPKLGTMKGKIVIHDPNWWKPMTDEEVDSFLDGKY